MAQRGAVPQLPAAGPLDLRRFGRQGYRLRSLTSYGPRHGGIGRISGVESAVRYTIPAPYGSYRDYVDSASAQLLDLSLFRHAPHGLKAGVYRDGHGSSRREPATRQGAAPKRAFGDAMFLQDFADRVSGGDDAPLYVFLHVFTPHTPRVTDAECTYTGRHMPLTPDNYLAQARCALRVVGLLLDRLRQLDLYDRSAIVVTSDHGTARFPRSDSPLAAFASPAGMSLHALELNATPLLLVKPFGAGGPLRTSDADRDRGPPGHAARPGQAPEHPRDRYVGPRARPGAAPRAHVRTPFVEPPADREHVGELLVRRAPPLHDRGARGRPRRVALPGGALRTGRDGKHNAGHIASG